MLMRKKRHEEVRRQWQRESREAAEEVAALEDETTRLEEKLAEYEQRWGSADGKVVLNAFQDALNLIRSYQESLSHASFSDPHIGTANPLLKRWGMEPISKSVFGFKENAHEITKAAMAGNLESKRQKRAARLNEEKIEQEMEEWGDEAFASERVRIMAEKRDDGTAHVWLEPVEAKQDD